MGRPTPQPGRSADPDLLLLHHGPPCEVGHRMTEKNGLTFREQDDKKLLLEFSAWYIAKLLQESLRGVRQSASAGPRPSDVEEFLKQRRTKSG